MADLRVHSNTSNIVRFVLKHSTTGQGLTGLTSASSGLIISTIADNEATATTYTAAGSTIETITTLGTFAAPTATKCRFKEVDATNHKGLYEFQFADARFAVASARRLIISVTGATNLLDTDYEIQLVQFNPYDGVRLGLTALPNVVAAGNGGLPTVDASNAVKVQSGTGANQISLASGLVTVGTNNDKTGYSLSGTQTFNVTGNITGNLSGSVGSVTGAVGSVTGNVGGNVVGSVGSVTGGVTVTTNNDKTGYKLASDGLDTISTTAPSGVASNFREMVVQTWRRFFRKSTLTSAQLKTYADNGSTVLTTQAVSDDTVTQTQDTAT